ncbi:MAG: 3-phenylpropionate/cinnamic acid dioxygenase subunit beta [SAR202 cluster bacterium]|nr:3-phenylpropionate/cinnamic acid dioxygenase subunit beta [SAR202 cluster bacterium]
MATLTTKSNIPIDVTDDELKLWFQFQKFYSREAWALDQRRYHDWLEMFTEDTHYFMPRRKNVRFKELDREVTGEDDLAAIFDENKTIMRIRVERLETGTAWAEDPPSRTRHLITNLEVEPRANGEVKARTAFLVYRSHLETEETLYAGGREDTLRHVDGKWKIAKRVVVLDANVIMAKNLSVFF